MADTMTLQKTTKHYVGELKGIDRERRTLTALISTDAVDRDGDVIVASGWQLDNYRKNPVVLWAHDYCGLPVAKALAIELAEHGLLATMQFAEHALANDVYDLYAGGFLRAFSVGFRPIEYERRHDERSKGYLISRAELLEFSAVPVPANQDALVLATKAVRLCGMDETKVVPGDVSNELADREMPWEAPTIEEFTDRPWDELSDEEKRRIAGHFAWARVMPPETFGDLKLPHHRASDGRVVWRGVIAAMAALLGGRGGVEVPASERRAIYDHLARYYRQFDEEPPEFRTADAAAHYLDLVERTRSTDPSDDREEDPTPTGVDLAAALKSLYDLNARLRGGP